MFGKTTEKVGRGKIPLRPVIHPSRSSVVLKVEWNSQKNWPRTKSTGQQIKYAMNKWTMFYYSTFLPSMTRITSRYTGSIQSTEVDGCVITHRQLETKWCGERSRARERKDHFSLFPKPNCHFHYRPTYFSPTFFYSRSCQQQRHHRRRRRTRRRNHHETGKRRTRGKWKTFAFFLQIKGGREGELKVLADSKIKVNEPKETHWTSQFLKNCQFWVPSGQPTANLTM